MKVFLPSIKATKLSFIRDILSDKKLHLKQNEVIRLDIPNYPRNCLSRISTGTP